MNIRTTIEFEDVDDLLKEVVGTGMTLLHDFLLQKLVKDGIIAPTENAPNGAGAVPASGDVDLDSVFGRAGAVG